MNSKRFAVTDSFFYGVLRLIHVIVRFLWCIMSVSASSPVASKSSPVTPSADAKASQEQPQAQVAKIKQLSFSFPDAAFKMTRCGFGYRGMVWKDSGRQVEKYSDDINITWSIFSSHKPNLQVPFMVGSVAHHVDWNQMRLPQALCEELVAKVAELTKKIDAVVQKEEKENEVLLANLEAAEAGMLTVEGKIISAHYKAFKSTGKAINYTLLAQELASLHPKKLALRATRNKLLRYIKYKKQLVQLKYFFKGEKLLVDRLSKYAELAALAVGVVERNILENYSCSSARVLTGLIPKHATEDCGYWIPHFSYDSCQTTYLIIIFWDVIKSQLGVQKAKILPHSSMSQPVQFCLEKGTKDWKISSSNSLYAVVLVCQGLYDDFVEGCTHQPSLPQEDKTGFSGPMRLIHTQFIQFQAVVVGASAASPSESNEKTFAFSEKLTEAAVKALEEPQS